MPAFRDDMMTMNKYVTAILLYRNNSSYPYNSL